MVACQYCLSNYFDPMGPINAILPGHQSQAFKRCPLYEFHIPTAFGGTMKLAQGWGAQLPGSDRVTGAAQGWVHLLALTGKRECDTMEPTSNGANKVEEEHKNDPHQCLHSQIESQQILAPPANALRLTKKSSCMV